MFAPITRRNFVKSTLGAGALAGLGDFAFLSHLPLVRAADGKPGAVSLSPDLEPLVRLIEETPREKLLGAAAAKVKAGTSYQQMLGALLLAGVRNIRPRPVGFEFHCVLVIHSAHQAALAAPDGDRWLPVFWALDNFKGSQATKRGTKKDDWVLPALDDSQLAPAAQAKNRFTEAMDAWDEDGADRAVAALTRAAGMGEVFELFARYGARDFRSIGHKAIYVANAFRTLNTIGWRHAEPVMRSLAYALLAHDGTNPAKADLEPDRPWRENLKRAAKVRADWQQGKVTPQAAADLLAVVRKGNWSDSSEAVVELLNKGVDPASVWDGLHLSAGELLMRQPGIVGLHCVTTANAMHYAYAASGSDETRRMITLQTAAFLAMFRQAMGGRGRVRDDIRIDTLEKADLKTTDADAVAEVFADVRRNGNNEPAARKALALLEGNPALGPALVAAGQRLVFAKGRDSHDYKFSSAALEDYHHITPHWRSRYLTSSLFWLHGSGDADNQLIQRARAALG